ncbi:hypothetical protein GM51_12900 [freshwater metagenome]|uniref:BIG2 domain-containing protein n=1 Tax=freshwater metagenome TaxID=449393 RepID=A0A094SDP7_9ZZZZ
MKTRVVAIVLIGVLFASIMVGLASSASAALNSISTRPDPVITTIDQGTITLSPPVSRSQAPWTVEITDPRIATANGLVITLKAVGSTVIRYVQPANGEFTNAVSDFSRLTINPGTPTLGTFADRTVNLSQNLFALTPPTSNSDGAWVYESLNTDIAVISGNLITLRDGGTVQIKATQAATARWVSVSKTMALTVNAPAPTIGSFSDITLSIDSVARVQLAPPSSTSKGAWTLTSSDPTIVGIDGLSLLTRKAGTATITARQAAAGGFRSTTTSMKVTVSAVTPNTTIGNFKDIAIDLDNGATKVVPFTSPTSTSPAAWSFISSDPATASVNGLALIALKPGTITLTANQPASGNFAAVGPISVKVTIRGNQQLAKPANITKLVGDPAIKIAYPPSLSNGAWSAISSAPTIVGINNESISFESAGRATITLTQSATDTYTASSTTFEVTVIGIPPTLGAFQPLTVGVGEKLTTPVTPQSPSTGRWIFTSSDPTIVSIVDNVITGIKAGTAIISAYQEPAGRYGQSPTVQATITVKPAPTITTPANIALVAGTQQVISAPTSNSLGTWVYTSSNPAIVAITGNSLSALAAGTATITASQAATTLFTAASRTFTITVTAAPVPRATAIPTKRVINVTLTNAAGKQVIVKINGAISRVGKNTVTPGRKLVTVQVDGRLILNKVIIIR